MLPSTGSTGCADSSWSWSGSPVLARQARLQGWHVASGALPGVQLLQLPLELGDALYVAMIKEEKCPGFGNLYSQRNKSFSTPTEAK